MAQEKVRVYVLARELNMESKDLLDLCQKANIDVKNQLSSLDPEQRDLLVEMVRKGGTAPSSPSTPRRPDTLPTPPPPIRDLGGPRKPSREGRSQIEAPPIPPPSVPIPPPPVPRPAAESRPPAAPPLPPPPVPLSRETRPDGPPAPAAETPVAPPSPPPPLPTAPEAAVPPSAPSLAPEGEVPPVIVPTPTGQEMPTEAAVATETPVAPLPTETPPAEAPAPSSEVPDETPATAQPAASAPAPETPRSQPTPPPGSRTHPPAATPPSPRPAPGPALNRPTTGPVRDLGQGGQSRPPGRSEGGGRTPQRPGGGRPLPTPTTSGRSGGPGSRPGIAAPPPPKTAKQGDDKKQPAPSTGPRRIAEIPPEMMVGDKPIRIEDLLRPPARPQAGAPGAEPGTVEVEAEDDDEAGRGKAGAKKKTTGVFGREQRHKDRNARAKEREQRGSGKGALLAGEDERHERGGTRLGRRPKIQKLPPTLARIGKVPIAVPITVRSLSEAIGIKHGEVLQQLLRLGAPMTININSMLDPELAEALALERGVELNIKRPLDVEKQLATELAKEDKPEDLVLRAPVVTIMGHVDHGKTSLLDRIRQSNVVATEAGGITQSLRAWRVEHGGRPVTFLDTPGHEAFTKMRARGANVTDIAVIVVAADDGVMPQTEEAVSHARAAGVSIVVAINKVDLPNANVGKTERRLYDLGLIPDNMGGDVPFVYTSAVTGKGIDDLLDNLSVVAELKELKANPNKPGQGTCLEATVSEGEGVYATLLVQDGTLRRGDILLCGAAHGRVRAMYNDLGLPIQEAGPGMPVRITGLDEVPNADDTFAVVEDLATAREIAEKRGLKLSEAALPARGPSIIEQLGAVKVVELKIILKADVRGSVEAIKKEMDKLQHEEVRVRVLHTGIGGITENDVNLALTSPQDTLIVGFNAVPDERAQALAEERGIQIREYDIIYKLTDDIRAALEGKLKPREEIVHLGRAIVRATFKISRVGTIAGCYVTQGTIERSALVRVIRGGIVVYPPADRTVGLDSLKRVKDDVREVQQGYECGIKISGYDDIKVDDVIEAYRIQKVQRTLDK